MTRPEPTREAALARLAAFAPRAGRAYEAGRNTDPGPEAPGAVSHLSPYIRHRMVTEAEVLAAVLDAHPPERAEKFIEEVFWRTYWKGWLEQRPAVWTEYEAALAADRARLAADGALRRRYEAATLGRTGIDVFDAWAAELQERNTLHNHARMWFASIWSFTLGLPWTLGADFFLRHLLDGDPASNTLSWRWVIGTQTRGKPYVARAGNIARYTGGRFDPAGQLDEAPAPILLPEPPPRRPIAPAGLPPAGPARLLLHEDDLGFESLDLGPADIVEIGVSVAPDARSPEGAAEPVRRWITDAAEDAAARASRHFGVRASLIEPGSVGIWAAAAASPVILPWTPAGWTASRLASLPAPIRLRRRYDEIAWPAASAGFFGFRRAIPRWLESGIARVTPCAGVM